MSDVADGVDCALVADPDEARPDDELTPRHELSPCWIVTGAVAAVAPVESVRVRVIDVPAAILTVQVNDVSVVEGGEDAARTSASAVSSSAARRAGSATHGPESEPPGTTRTAGMMCVSERRGRRRCRRGTHRSREPSRRPRSEGKAARGGQRSVPLPVEWLGQR